MLYMWWAEHGTEAASLIGLCQEIRSRTGRSTSELPNARKAVMLEFQNTLVRVETVELFWGEGVFCAELVASLSSWW